jgi:2-C-methyl-D-erythritol 4-phosphate cytidylyltransferase
MITPEKIERVFEVARGSGAATLAEPINDTLKRVDVAAVAASADEAGDLIIKESVDRSGIYGMQTPQVFEKKLLEKAYDAVAKKKISVTDEVSAVELLGHRIVLVPNYDFNFKVTYPRDLPLAEFVLKQRASATRH